MTFVSATQFHVYLLHGMHDLLCLVFSIVSCYHLKCESARCFETFNQKKALVGVLVGVGPSP